MKRIVGLLVIAALALSALPGLAHEAGHMGAASMKGMKGMEHHAGAGGTSLTGEIVDTGCYLGSGERGAKHVSCATKCIGQGMPMGLLTSDETLYLLTMNHDNPDPFNQLKKLAGKTVTVTGSVMTRGGMKGIDVSAYKLAGAVASK
jgi:hypothetical protein